MFNVNLFSAPANGGGGSDIDNASLAYWPYIHLKNKSAVVGTSRLQKYDPYWNRYLSTLSDSKSILINSEKKDITTNATSSRYEYVVVFVDPNVRDTQNISQDALVGAVECLARESADVEQYLNTEHGGGDRYTKLGWLVQI